MRFYSRAPFEEFMRRQAVAVLLLCAVVVLSIPATGALAAQEPAEVSLPASVQRITSVEGVTEYRLGNGLRVLLFSDVASPKVTVNVTYLVGSRNESYGETGMAHLLEHLMFKGSRSHPNIPDEISQHGAADSWATNATTNSDRTNYYETFPATTENLEWALSLEADRMVNSFIAKRDLNSEMTVVRNEFERGENDPTGILYQRVLEAAYTWHNYHHPTIGSRSDIEKVPIEHLQAFYRTYYQPDNAVLIVVGKIDEQKTLATIQKTFGAIPNPSRALPQPYTEEPTQDGERDIVLRRVGDKQAVIAAYHVPSSDHPDAVALNVLAGILGEPAAGRLRKRLIETNLAAEADPERGRGTGDRYRTQPLPYAHGREIRESDEDDRPVVAEPGAGGGGGAWRLAAVLLGTRPGPEGHIGRPASGRGAVSGALEPDRWHVYSGRKFGAGCDSRDSGLSGDAEGLQRAGRRSRGRKV
jgi:zinc protease